MKLALASAADAAYAPLLRSMIESVARHGRRPMPALCIIDGGLEAADRAWLSARGAQIVRPDWYFEFGALGTPKIHEHAFFARPMLPQVFPGFDIYLWIDADCWLQDWRAVELLTTGARMGRLAAIPEIDRGYEDLAAGLVLDEAPDGTPHIANWRLYDYYRTFFEAKASRDLSLRPLINCGVFALRADAPHWPAWAASVRLALTRSRAYMVEQCALNHAVLVGDLPVALLPSWCNWICCRGLPAFDPPSSLLVEPHLPHHPISIVHMALDTKWRDHRLATTTGGSIVTPLRFGEIAASMV